MDSIAQLDKIKSHLLDPLAIDLTNTVQWLHIQGISENKQNLYPVAITGNGKPLLMLHGFDSCFLEFRRLSPLLSKNFKLIIPDLYGFGFCPRPKDSKYGMEAIINYLEKLIRNLDLNTEIGLIGASMGGGISMELARRNESIFNKILLLSPAGITGKKTPVPPPFDRIGANILKQKFIRKNLCRQAFANPNDVGDPEEQIASVHINVPGWERSLAAFAREGGVANCGLPIPKQPLNIIWGEKDRILSKKIKQGCINLLDCNYETLESCGHLPHLEKPEFVNSFIENIFK